MCDCTNEWVFGSVIKQGSEWWHVKWDKASDIWCFCLCLVVQSKRVTQPCYMAHCSMWCIITAGAARSPDNTLLYGTLFHNDALTLEVLLYFMITHCPINWLASEWSRHDFLNLVFKLIVLIAIFRPSYESAFSWIPRDITDDKWTLGQVMAWCCQAPRHYLSQCWPSSLLLYGPQ